MQSVRRATPIFTRALSSRSPASTRLYASTAVPLNEPLEDIGVGTSAPKTPQSVQVTTLENGVKVASLETHTPSSRLALFFDAGSRYETQDNLGITHFLRNAAFGSTEDRSAFRIAREIEQYGGSLEATCTREHLVYSSDCLRSGIDAVIENLASVIHKPAFKPWELEEIVNRIKVDIATADSQPPVGVLEALHEVAFRRGLGNSVHCLPHNIGKFTPDMLLSYAKDSYVGQRMAVVGVGVEHDRLVGLAKAAFSSVPKGSPAPKVASKYFGGEVMRHRGGSLVHAALVADGAILGSKDALAAGVYQKILGSTPFIKWSSNTASNRLNKAVSEVTDGPFSASAFSANYSDAGLFGFYAIAEPSNISKVMGAVVGQFGKAAKGEISDQELTRAKNQLKGSILMNAESQATLAEDIGTQVLVSGSYTSPEEAAKMVDSVTKDDVLAVAKRLFTGKPCLSASGNVTAVPRIDELF